MAWIDKKDAKVLKFHRRILFQKPLIRSVGPKASPLLLAVGYSIRHSSVGGSIVAQRSAGAPLTVTLAPLLPLGDSRPSPQSRDEVIQTRAWL